VVRREPQVLVQVEERSPGEREALLPCFSTSLRYIPSGVVPVGIMKTVSGLPLSFVATASAAVALIAS
jgi:hypothetical protein